MHSVPLAGQIHSVPYTWDCLFLFTFWSFWSSYKFCVPFYVHIAFCTRAWTTLMTVRFNHEHDQKEAGA